MPNPANHRLFGLDGIFDDPNRAVREKFADGRLLATIPANALTAPLAKQYGMRGKFGSYPAPPTPAAQKPR